MSLSLLLLPTEVPCHGAQHSMELLAMGFPWEADLLFYHLCLSFCPCSLSPMAGATFLGNFPGGSPGNEM